MYDLRSRRARPLVPRQLRLELDERTLYDGTIRRPVDRAQLNALVETIRREGVEAVAVGLLHSYANPENELAVGRTLAEALPEATVCLSHEVVGQQGEYERFSTCAMNAFVQPLIARYLAQLESRLQAAGVRAAVMVMKSNGGVMSAPAAARQCVETILSGPAGGVVSGAAIARAHTNHNLITADMGGTSFDVSVIHESQPTFAHESEIGGLASGVPLLDIHTIGAGGGSVAWIDSGGALRVGPTSAGADPGPACYGRGGNLPTVTDANVVLGRLAAGSLLAGGMQLDTDAARRVIHDHLANRLGISIETAAEGVIRVVNAAMTAAIRRLTVERGFDPRDFVLCPFGGAGPLHGAELARELGIAETLVPIAPGVTSAVGLLMSNLREDRVRTHVSLLTEDALPTIERLLAELADEASERLQWSGANRRIHRSLGARYLGQRYELRVNLADSELNRGRIEDGFHQEHRRAYGYMREGEAVEVCSLWVSVEVDLEPVALPCRGPTTDTLTTVSNRQVIFAGQSCDTPIFRREAFGAGSELVGPAIVEQLDATTVVWPGQVLRVDEFGQLILGQRD
jgi:N-methylhydantoinase A